MAVWQDYIANKSPLGHTVVGNVQVLERLYSLQLDNQRNLVVYLPPSYESSERRYPVLYMHDGQNLFDRATSYVGEWQVDEKMEALRQEGLEAIVVGVPNMGEERMVELLLDKGYRPGEDLLYVEERRALHHESAWARCLPAALRFLFACACPA